MASWMKILTWWLAALACLGWVGAGAEMPSPDTLKISPCPPTLTAGKGGFTVPAPYDKIAKVYCSPQGAVISATPQVVWFRPGSVHPPYLFARNFADKSITSRAQFAYFRSIYAVALTAPAKAAHLAALSRYLVLEDQKVVKLGELVAESTQGDIHHLVFFKLADGVLGGMICSPDCTFREKDQNGVPFSINGAKALATLPVKAGLPGPKDKGGSPLPLAAWSGNLGLIKGLLARGEGIDARDAQGNTALFQAARRNLKTTTRLLLDGGSAVNLLNDRGETALAQTADTGVIRLLLDKGADPNEKGEKDAHLPLTRAAENPEAVRLLLAAKADPNALGFSGNPPLIAALQARRFTSMELLLSAGARVDGRGFGQSTPLMWAAAWEGAAVERILDLGGDLEARDHHGGTALMWAVLRQRLDIVSLLMDKGAQVNAQDKAGHTALDLALHIAGEKPLPIDLPPGRHRIDARAFLPTSPLGMKLADSLNVIQLRRQGRTAWDLQKEKQEIIRLLQSHGAKTQEALTGSKTPASRKAIGI